jgi:hypothetical protein
MTCKVKLVPYTPSESFLSLLKPAENCRKGVSQREIPSNEVFTDTIFSALCVQKHHSSRYERFFSAGNSHSSRYECSFSAGNSHSSRYECSFSAQKRHSSFSVKSFSVKKIDNKSNISSNQITKN